MIKPIYPLCAALLCATLLHAPGASALKIGDPAPDLKIGGILKGGSVKSELKDLGEIYVVEFWATWCGPCRQSIPHLTELQAKYKDQGVTVIGITDETEAEVKPFVESMGEKMEFTVALDADKQSWETYAKPFGVTGIPHAFVVDRTGTLVWHGHPMAGLDDVLAKVVEGKYDVETALAEAKKSEMREELGELTMLWAQEYFVLSRFGRDTEAADAVGKKLLECGFDDPVFYGQVAWTLLSNDDLAYKNNEYALEVARLANELAEGKSADLLDTLSLGLFLTGKKDEAIATQKQAIAICDNEDLLEQLKQRLARYESS